MKTTKRVGYLGTLIVAAALPIIVAATIIMQTVNMQPDSQLTVTCPTTLTAEFASQQAILHCAPATPSPTPTASPTPTPTATPVPGGSLTLPVKAIFYYPWFPESWNQNGINPFTRYHPSLGYYDSGSPSVIQSHVASMVGAGLQAGIASWWGKNSPTDGRVNALLANAGPTFKWTLYHEGEGLNNPSSASISSDLDYILANYASNPAFLRVAGKPVLFVYANGSDNCGMADRWKIANANRFYLVLKVFSGYKTCANQPNSWHQYAPAVATDRQAGYSFSISPGFWRPDEATPRLARDLNRFKANVAAMKASGDPWQLVTTFNEWGEGTSIEPASEWGNAYLDALGGVISPSPSPTATASPQATSTATSTATASPVGTPLITASPSPTATAAATPTASPIPTASPVSTPAPGAVTIVAAGDIASSGSGDSQTAALITSLNPTWVLTLGDNAYPDGSSSNFTNYYGPTWGAFKAKTNPSPGNHDYVTSGAAGFRGFFARWAPADPLYYAYNLGGWRVYSLDSEISHSATSAQVTWLKNDLAANPNQCTLALWHKPRWSSGNTHGSDSSFQPFWDALATANADVILNGHEHNYERFAPIQGIREFVVGTGGVGHYGFGSPIANSQVRNSAAFGVIKLVLSPGSYSWQFMPVAGQSFTDSGSEACH